MSDYSPAMPFGSPTLPSVGTAIQAAVDGHDIARAIMVVVASDQVIHLEGKGPGDNGVRL